MELNPNAWHLRPDDCDKTGPCTLCGCPAAGTRANNVWHRATLETEGLAFPFVVRMKGPKGWQHKGVRVVTRRPRIVDPVSARDLELEEFARLLDADTDAADRDSPGGNIPLAGDVTNPGQTTIDLMARAATLHVMDKGSREIEQVLDLKRGTVQVWANHWPEHWQMACQSAETQLVRMVKAQIGTAAILDDVDGYLERAETADRLAPIVPKWDKPTLCTFFESFVRPNCLYDVKPISLTTYLAVVKLWRLVTGDPPLDSITVQTLSFFRDATAKRRGLRPHTKTSATTVASHLRHLQMILDKAGPPGRRNRDAQGLIANPPWIRPPRMETKLPRVIAPEVFKRIYDATAGMDWPQVPGIRAPAWWKSLLVVAFNTQLRRRTLFEMRMDEIDWQGHCLRLPAGRLKARRPMIVHLNAAAMEALRAIRTTRELIFPRNAKYHTTFQKHFHHLQNSAGIPRKEHIGLHVIRKTAATALATISPQAAQLALGHTHLSTTINNYINPTAITCAALDAIPQPFGLSSAP